MTTTRVPSLLLLLGLVCLASPAALAQDPEVFGEGEATVPAEAEEAPRPRPTGPGNEDIDLDRLFPPDRR
ncbi:MAG TPA: hypothetical protein VEI97_18720, partial [bacterium]|nr:hypothetical protein [bacterium]